MPIHVSLEIGLTLVRSGLRRLLASAPDVQVEDSGPGASEADVFVIGLGGADELAAVRAAAGRRKVVLLSSRGDEETAIAALRAGALGFVSLDADTEGFLHTIREAAAGRVCVRSSGVRTDVPEFLRIAENASSVIELLSPRERQVLPLAARGLGNGDIAVRLGIGVRTVETHRARLMRKIAARDQTELVRYAERAGVLGEGAPPNVGAAGSVQVLSVRRRIFSKGPVRGNVARKKYGG